MQKQEGTGQGVGEERGQMREKVCWEEGSKRLWCPWYVPDTLQTDYLSIYAGPAALASSPVLWPHLIDV